MPELPEVETTARALRGLVLGRRVLGVSGVDWPRMLPNSDAAEMDAVLSGLSIRGVGRRGKYLLLEFEGEISLAVHRKMSGNLLLRKLGAPPEPHTHFVLELDDGRQLRLVDARKFGRVYLFRTPEEQATFMASRLGPEPLSEYDLATRLRGRRARIKALLLDQAFLAGVGNLYADEALWEARIHPLRPADSLSSQEIKRLAAAIQRVLTEAIERRGTSFSTYRDADGTPGENQAFLRAYGRGNQPCPRCGRPIQRLVIGARGSHFCARCQPATPVRRRAASRSAPRT